jgi:4-hydroxy-tetrahydrodipicolinate synthase
MTTPNSAAALEPGVWGILATPFEGPDGDIDFVSFTRQIEMYRGVGARGVVALGVFGEAAKLTSAEQRAIVDACAGIAGELGVVIGVTALSTAPAIAQAEAAVAGLGDALSGVMVQVNSGDPAIVTAHLHAIHAATGTGVVLQDYPKTSGIRIGTPALLDVINSCPFTVAVKAEAPPTPPAIADLTAATAVPVFGGLGGVGLLDELAAGAAGAMTGFSHPEGLVAAVDAYRAAGFAAAYEAYARWLPIANFEGQEGAALAIRKAILHERGIIDNAAVRQPAGRFPEQLRETMMAHLRALGTA